MPPDRSSSYFLNALERAAAKTVASVVDSCAGTDREPRTEGHASTGRAWTSADGREWRITITVDVEPVPR